MRIEVNIPVVDTKTCSDCKAEKPFSEFNKNGSRKDGLQANCKACKRDRRLADAESISEYQKNYRRENREDLKVWHRQNYEENREQILQNQKNQRETWGEEKRAEVAEYQHNYWLENRDELLAVNRQWRVDNPDLVKEYHENYRAQNHEKIVDYHKIYCRIPEVRSARNARNVGIRKTNVQVKISHDARTRRRLALKEAAAEKPCGFLDALGCSLEEWQEYLQRDMPVHSKTGAVATWDDFMAAPTRVHVDEVVPVTSWDLTNEFEYRLCFHFSNSQLLWADDNLRKGGHSRDPKKYVRLKAEKIQEFHRRVSEGLPGLPSFVKALPADPTPPPEVHVNKK